MSKDKDKTVIDLECLARNHMRLGAAMQQLGEIGLMTHAASVSDSVTVFAQLVLEASGNDPDNMNQEDVLALATIAHHMKAELSQKAPHISELLSLRGAICMLSARIKWWHGDEQAFGALLPLLSEALEKLDAKMHESVSDDFAGLFANDASTQPSAEAKAADSIDDWKIHG